MDPNNPWGGAQPAPGAVATTTTTTSNSSTDAQPLQQEQPGSMGVLTQGFNIAPLGRSLLISPDPSPHAPFVAVTSAPPPPPAADDPWVGYRDDFDYSKANSSVAEAYDFHAAEDDLVGMVSQSSQSWHPNGQDFTDPWPTEEDDQQHPQQHQGEEEQHGAGSAAAAAAATAGSGGSGDGAPALPFRPPDVPPRPSVSGGGGRGSQTRKNWFQGGLSATAPVLPSYVPVLPDSFYETRRYVNRPKHSIIQLLPVEGPPPPQRAQPSSAAATIAKAPLDALNSLTAAVQRLAPNSPILPPGQQQALPPSSSSQQGAPPNPNAPQPRMYFVNISRVSCILARLRLPPRLPGSNATAPTVLSTSVLLTTRLPTPRTHPAHSAPTTTALRVAGTWISLRERLPPFFVLLPIARRRPPAGSPAAAAAGAAAAAAAAGGGEIVMEAAVNAQCILGIHAYDEHWTTLVVEADVRPRVLKKGGASANLEKVLATLAPGSAAAAAASSARAGEDGLPGMAAGAQHGSGGREEADRGLFSFEVAAPILEVLQLIDSDGFPAPHGI
ncbi:hypothetical protein DFJ73DRAFT_776829 [Zopfochytrium polystomum]|nr:hypothetical protein DFJ73DRAFT_776829 [Zopfochytrium polystomum]